MYPIMILIHIRFAYQHKFVVSFVGFVMNNKFTELNWCILVSLYIIAPTSQLLNFMAKCIARLSQCNNKLVIG